MKVTPVRIGIKYQAELPPLPTFASPRTEQPRGNDNRSGTFSTTATATMPRPLYTQRWTPSRFTTEEVTEFLRSFCRLNEAEVGLHCLMESDFDIQTAVQLLHTARRAKQAAQRIEIERVSDDTFGSAIATHGKRFFVIQQKLASMTTSDVVRRFYLWKTSSAYRIYRERAKARRNKDTMRLRAARSAAGTNGTGNDEDEYDDRNGGESDDSDFHNEFCELCCTGGQLLCCDGCERAYHFSCVTPPIDEIPTGDWFCPHCTSAVAACVVSVQPSAEDAHCQEVIVSDAETLDLESVEYEQDDDEGEEIEDGDENGDVDGQKQTDDDDDDASDSSGRTMRQKLELESRRSGRQGDSVSIKTEGAPSRLLLSPPQRMHQQPGAARKRALTSPATVALVLEPSANERKRKRKIEAPRRIQSASD